MPARRLSLSVLVSLALHGAAVAAFAWLAATAPLPISAGEEGIPVELVAAAQSGAASERESASGREETQTPSSDSLARQAVEAPAETKPEPSGDPTSPAQPEAVAATEPDPIALAETRLAALPPPPMPDERPVIEAPAEPAPQPAGEALPEAVPHPAPQPIQEQAAQPSPVPSEVQAAIPQPTEPPPVPAPAPPPVVAPAPAQPQVTRPPPARRETAPVRERTRPDARPVAQPRVAQPRAERTAPPSRQAEARASQAERGEGAGQRNRDASTATGAAGAASAAALAAWRQRVLAHLARYKIYPEQARDNGIRGRAAVAFTVTASGSVTAVAIASSSGAAILDHATLAMVRRAQPFPPNPAGSSASFTAGITYSLY